ncbi:MAG: alkaline phosphatase [Sandaracinaceae bacterium]
MSSRQDDGAADAEETGRRSFLKTTLAGSAALLVGCDGASGTRDAGPIPDGSPRGVPEAGGFGLGVASGDVGPSSAVLWTHYDGAEPLSLVVWDASGAEVFVADVTPADGGFLHVEVDTLAAGVRHRFGFFETAEDAGETRRVRRSPIGAFRTAIAEDALESLVIGAVCCTENHREKTPLRRVADHDDFDLFLLGGDTSYNDGAETLSEYREKWAESLSSEGLVALRRTTSVLATWDDHEVDNNFNPEIDDVETARTAFFENLPLRRDASEPDRIWKSIRWGRTAEVFVTDTRGERRPSTRGADDIFISRAQMDWLKAGLADSPCRFKLILNAIPIGDFPILSSGDRWEGYPRQREELLSHIEDTSIEGVLFVSGDFHLASAGFVGAVGQPGEAIREVLVGPGAQVGNPSAFLLRSSQWSWASVTNNYARMELDPVDGVITTTWHDGDDAVIHEERLVL